MDNNSYIAYGTCSASSINNNHINRQNTYANDMLTHSNISTNNNSSKNQRRFNLFQLQNENKSLSVSLDKMNEVNSMLSSQIYKMSSERKELIDKVDQLSSRVKSLECKLDQSLIDTDNLKRIIDRLTTENEKTASDCSRLKKANDDLLNQIENIKQENCSLKQDNESYRYKCEDYSDRNGYLLLQYEKVKSKTDDYNRINELLYMTQSENKQLAIENKELFKKYEDALATINVNSNNHMSNMKMVMKENCKLKSNLDLFSKENHSAAVKIRELENRITALMKYQNENESLHQMVNDLKERIETIQYEITSMKQLNKNKSINITTTTNGN